MRLSRPRPLLRGVSGQPSRACHPQQLRDCAELPCPRPHERLGGRMALPATPAAGSDQIVVDVGDVVVVVVIVVGDVVMVVAGQVHTT
jgi:hypothetical protein